MKKVFKNIPRIFYLIFMTMFVISLFMGTKVFAETSQFIVDSYTMEDKSETTTGSVLDYNETILHNDITFHKLNDYVTYKIVIKSNIDKEITILSITDDNDNEYIVYEYDKHENEKLNANSTFDFIVKAIYKNEVTDTSKRNQTSNVKFTINYLEDGEVKGDTIIINPKTGDNIGTSFIFLIISSVGLITCIVIDKKRKNKKLSKVSTLIITGLVLTPIVVKAATVQFNLTLSTNYKLHNKLVVTIDDKVNEPKKEIIEYNTTIDSLSDTIKEGYTFTKWTVNNEEFDITEEIKEDITIEANYTPNEYTIKFNANTNDSSLTGSTPDKEMVYDQKDNLTSNGYSIEGYVFDSWNTESDGSGTSYSDEESVTNLAKNGEVILYAQWKLPICKRATTLHTETCAPSSKNYFCRKSGYAANETITYGQLGTEGQAPQSGDAFDCDVNGDGLYDENTERFYYVSNYFDTSTQTFNNDYYTFIYYSNTTAGIPSTDSVAWHSSRYDEYQDPSTVVAELPTISQWRDGLLKTRTRNILIGNDVDGVSNVFISDYSYEGYAARLLTVQEVKSACPSAAPTSGSMDNCQYFFERTQYSTSSYGTQGPWLESAYTMEEETPRAWRIGASPRWLHSNNAWAVDIAGARPVIEIQKSKISY